ncbi:MAG: archaetidylserine decarboxylase [Candidatus Omnitrophota bacterium]
MKILTRLFLSILSIRFFSRMYGKIVRLRRPRFLVKRAIRYFQKHYRIDMNDCKGKPEDYPSLLDFFIRELDSDKRRLVPVPDAIVSPADGRLSEIETVYSDQATQVKGKTYCLSEMVGTPIDFSDGWHVAIIYLSPSNYHRFHFPLSGNVTRYLHTGPRLYPVNHLGLHYVNRLFIRNERIVTELETQIDNRTFRSYIVAVGATFVGSIRLDFMTEPKKRKHQWIPVNRDVHQLVEMGRFEMGSTIILVIPKAMATPIMSKKGLPVKAGEPLFKIV